MLSDGDHPDGSRAGAFADGDEADGFLKSKGYQEVVVVLLEERDFIVEGWSKESRDVLNRGPSGV